MIFKRSLPVFFLMLFVMTFAHLFWLQSADILLSVFHILLIVFNTLGWIWKPLRKAHLVSLLLTFSSWIFLGIWYGWGYCPFTDWHWSVLYKLGHTKLPGSYISFLIYRAFRIMPSGNWVDVLTLGVALVALAVSVWLNFFRKKCNRHLQPEEKQN